MGMLRSARPRHDNRCRFRKTITSGEMRAIGVRRVIVFCSGYKCSHSVTMDADQWPDDLRLSDIEARFTCTACGNRGADVRGPIFEGIKCC